MKGLHGVPPKLIGVKEIYRNRALQGAYKKGILAASEGLPLQACPYADKRGGNHGQVVTYSRSFIKAWQRGWWDNMHEMKELKAGDGL